MDFREAVVRIASEDIYSGVDEYDFRTKYNVQILAVDFEADEDTEEEIPVGEITFSMVYHKFTKKGMLSNLDDISGELSHIYSELYQEAGEFFGEVNHKLDYPSAHQIAVIENIYVNPQFRGHYFGLQALDLTLRYLANRQVEVVVLTAYPEIKREEIETLNLNDLDLKEYEELEGLELKDFFISLGFEAIGTEKMLAINPVMLKRKGGLGYAG